MPNKTHKTMKTKSLFLTIGLLLSVSFPLWAGTILTDEFVASDLDSDMGLTDGNFTLFCEAGSNVITSSDYGGINSDAEYVGQIGYNEANDLLILNNKHILATKTTGGKPKQVYITWASTGNTVKKSQIFVYAGTTAFAGNETKTAVGKKATLIGTLTFSAAGDASVDIPSGYSQIAIVGASYDCYLEYISVDWEEITYYGVSVNPGLTNGSIALGKTSAEEGETVSMRITPDMGYELISYSYNATVVNLTPAEYTSEEKRVSFTMPDEDVVVSATFQVIPDRELSDFYFFASTAEMASFDFTDEISIHSGENTTIYFVMDPIYDASTLTFNIESSSHATIVSHTYSTLSGEGTVVLKGYAAGETTLTITAAQTATFDEAIGEVTIVVEPKQVILVTEYNGKFFAATNTLSGSNLAAQEVIVANGKVFFDPDATYKLADMTWNYEVRVVDEEEIYTLSTSGTYLRSMTSTAFSLQASYYAWVYEGGRLISANSKGIKYSNSADAFKAVSYYEDGADFSASVYPIAASSAYTFNSYDRSLTNGNYATMCLPYAVSPTFLSGIEVYRITGKSMSGSKVNGIALEEVTDVLVAGQPYVIKATASTLNAKYGEATVAVPVDDDSDGLVGNLDSSPLAVPDGCYGLSKNQLRKVNGGTATVGQYRAYIDLSEVDELGGGGASAPGRIILYAQPEENVENPDDNGNNDNNGNTGEGSEVATSLEDFLNNASPINWNEPVYNTLGQRVGKGSTGVLIQNGQKFLVK